MIYLNIRVCCIYIFLFYVSAHGQLDSVKYFYVLNSDTNWQEPVIEAFTGKYKKNRRQFYTLKKEELITKLNSRNIPFAAIETIDEKNIFDYPLIIGQYEKGVKSGRWMFINDYGTSYSTCYQMYPDSTITYKADTIIKEIFKGLSVISKSQTKDKNTIVGFFEGGVRTRILFECDKIKDKCVFKLENGSILLSRIKFDDLDFVLNRIKKGAYDKEIKNYLTSQNKIKTKDKK